MVTPVVRFGERAVLVLSYQKATIVVALPTDGKKLLTPRLVALLLTKILLISLAAVDFVKP
jgi:hypothetical protein